MGTKVIKRDYKPNAKVTGVGGAASTDPLNAQSYRTQKKEQPEDLS